MRTRFEQFGLELHGEKTRLLEFGRYAAGRRQRRELGKPETFDFLGFTHICARRHSDGRSTVWRKTIAKRMRAKLREIKEDLMRRRHEPVPKVAIWLRSVVQGYFNYHAVPDNIRTMTVFRGLINRFWLRALRRRSQKGKYLNWGRMQSLIKTWIPPAKLLHPYPNQRLVVSHPR
jgi:RNA-directed DNA polymerase